MKSELNVWYTNYETIGGEVIKLQDDFMLIIRESRQLGLCVNVRKCELITSDAEVVRTQKVSSFDT